LTEVAASIGTAGPWGNVGRAPQPRSEHAMVAIANAQTYDSISPKVVSDPI